MDSHRFVYKCGYRLDYNMDFSSTDEDMLDLVYVANVQKNKQIGKFGLIHCG